MLYFQFFFFFFTALIESIRNGLLRARPWQYRNCTCNGKFTVSNSSLIQCLVTEKLKRKRKRRGEKKNWKLFFLRSVWTYFSLKRFWMSFSAAEKNSSSSDSVGIILFSTVDLRRVLAGVGLAVDSSSLDGVVSLLREKNARTLWGKF